MALQRGRQNPSLLPPPFSLIGGESCSGGGGANNVGSGSAYGGVGVGGVGSDFASGKGGGLAPSDWKITDEIPEKNLEEVGRTSLVQGEESQQRG